jgi:hypothetical protein
MARGTALSVLLAMVKAEIGDNSGTNSAADAAIQVQLSNLQKWLATEYDWPFLERRWDVAVPANTQFVTFPTKDDNDATNTAQINFERMPKVEVFWNNVYQPVIYGIGIDEYNTLDFALQQQSDPIQRWRAATNPNEQANPNTFEVWPVPVTAQTLRFTGQRALLPLAVSADTADLDDMLLVMGVAAEKLQRSKQADAQMKLAKFNNRLQFIRQNYPTRDKVRVLGGGGENEFRRERKLAGMIIVVK